MYEGILNMTKQLLVNKIQCPDGTILESRHRHDYKEHTQEDGRIYIVDGGLSYQRLGGTDKEFINLAVFSDDPHEKIREHFKWGRCMGKDGNSIPLEFILLKDLDDGHIKALVDYTSKGYPDYINKVMVDEFNYRGLE